MTEHRVGLAQVLDLGGHDLGRDAHLARQLLLLRRVCGRNSCSGGSSVRIVTGRSPIARKMPTKSLALHGQQLGERLLATLDVVGEDHLAHGGDAVAAEEHVLRAAEADALRAEGDGVGRLVGLVGVGAHQQLAPLVGPLHDLGVVAVRF